MLFFNVYNLVRIYDLGPVVRKPISANPELIVKKIHFRTTGPRTITPALRWALENQQNVIYCLAFDLDSERAQMLVVAEVRKISSKDVATSHHTKLTFSLLPLGSSSVIYHRKPEKKIKSQ